MYNSKLLFTVRVPEPGTRAATPAQTLVELKAGVAKRSAYAAVRLADRALGGTVRGSRYNRHWTWWAHLFAGFWAIVEGMSILAIVAGLFGRVLP